MAARVRLLIVDDSAAFRSLFRRAFEAEPDTEVVGSVADPYEARDLIVAHKPDIVTLDMCLPRMDGVSFLRKIMASPLPMRTVLLSSATAPGSRLALEALAAGALEVLQKPTCATEEQRWLAHRQLARHLRSLAHVPLPTRAPLPPRPPEPPRRIRTVSLPPALGQGVVIGLGASTGGVAALGEILPQFPAHGPPVIVVQHMPAGFTSGFAERLAAECPMRVLEAVHGQSVEPGLILIAPGGTRHLEVEMSGGSYRVALLEGPPRGGHLPSIDVFFASLARAAGPLAAACLLTGMGRDGAEGLTLMRRAGARTFAQDQASSSVWGMPHAAYELGAAEALVPLERVPEVLLQALGTQARSSLATRHAEPAAASPDDPPSGPPRGGASGG